MQWHIGRMILSLLSSAVLIDLSYALDREQSYVLYQSLRKGFQEEFNKIIELSFEYNRRRSAPKEIFELASDGTKMLLYNKAYIVLECGQLAPKGDLSSINIFMEDCTNDRMQALRRIFGPPEDVEAKRKAMKSIFIACHDQARLTEAEKQFPPYDFLAGPMTHLFDIKKLDSCLARFGLQ